ncbi:hypothetical protein Hanom_Chr11g01051661 [Helianthus anomalus]
MQAIYRSRWKSYLHIHTCNIMNDNASHANQTRHPKARCHEIYVNTNLKK